MEFIEILIKKVLSYSFIEGIAKGLNKLIILILPFFLSASNFGLLGLILSLEVLFPFITLLGFDRAILRFYNIKRKSSKLIFTVFNSTTLLHLIILILIFICYLYFGNIALWGIHLFPDLFFVVILVYFNGVNLYLLNIIRIEEKHQIYYIGRLLFQLTKLLVVILLVWYFKNYMGYVYGSVLAAIVTYIFLRYKLKKPQTINITKIDKKTFLLLFSFSWPFIFHSIAGNLLGNLDRFIIKQYTSAADVGIYTLAYSIGSMMAFAFIGITVYIEPLIYKERDTIKRNALLNNFLFLSIIMGSLFCFIILLFSDTFFLRLYHDKLLLAKKYIPIIASAYLIYPYYIKGNYTLIYNKNTKIIALFSIISSLVGIILDIIFVPKYGILASSTVVFVFFAFQSLFFSIYINKYDKDLYGVFKIIISIIILSLGFLFRINNYVILFTFLVINLLFFYRKFTFEYYNLIINKLRK